MLTRLWILESGALRIGAFIVLSLFLLILILFRLQVTFPPSPTKRFAPIFAYSGGSAPQPPQQRPQPQATATPLPPRRRRRPPPPPLPHRRRCRCRSRVAFLVFRRRRRFPPRRRRAATSTLIPIPMRTPHRPHLSPMDCVTSNQSYRTARNAEATPSRSNASSTTTKVRIPTTPRAQSQVAHRVRTIRAAAAPMVEPQSGVDRILLHAHAPPNSSIVPRRRPRLCRRRHRRRLLCI